jgi:ornithine carbamoyltransferase
MSRHRPEPQLHEFRAARAGRMRPPGRPALVPAGRRLRKDFLSVLDFSAADLERCLAVAAQLKAERPLGRVAPTAQVLAGLHVAMLFEKPSLRTRSTFEIAVRELGGEVIEPPHDSALGRREALRDVARNLERWVAGAIIRTYSQQMLQEFATAAPRLHVINALSDQEHPCQALADVLTLQERWGRVAGRTLAYVGDGNNVATSLVHAGALLGIHVRLAAPEGFDLPDHVVEQAAHVARGGATVRLFRDPVEAVTGVHAVYTDVWTSMGQEEEIAERRAVFAPYQVNATLMAHARPDALFMHCLPAHRNEEVTDEVIDSPQSVVFDQAENRLHTQKALLLMLLGPRDPLR